MSKKNNKNNNKKVTKTNNDELDMDLDTQESLEASGEVDYVEDYVDEPYTPPNQLHIPDEAKAKFEGLGFELQWVRVFEPNSGGKLDHKNVQRKENDRYQFVTREEIPGLGGAMSSFFGDEVDKNSHGLYIVGDLALAKVHRKHVEAKRRYNMKRANTLNASVIDGLRKDGVMPSTERSEGWKIEEERPDSSARSTQFG